MTTPSRAEDEELFFRSLKEDRGWYFVEYYPPISGDRFATLQLVIPGEARSEDIANSMEAELKHWLRRFPIPIMASAFDGKGDLLPLDGIRECNHLIGYLNEREDVIAVWRLLKNEELPARALDRAYLKDVYSNIPFKTKRQLREEANEHGKRLRVGWIIVFVWAVVVPAAVAILEWWSNWLGAVVLIYSLWKAVEKALRLTGKWPKSKAELEKEAEEVRARHHHYHCERNPEGFQRLKAENFERWEKERINEEAQALKRVTRNHETTDG